jgi:hypothetical protein
VRASAARLLTPQEPEDVVGDGRCQKQHTHAHEHDEEARPQAEAEPRQRGADGDHERLDPGEGQQATRR